MKICHCLIYSLNVYDPRGLSYAGDPSSSWHTNDLVSVGIEEPLWSMIQCLEGCPTRSNTMCTCKHYRRDEDR